MMLKIALAAALTALASSAYAADASKGPPPRLIYSGITGDFELAAGVFASSGSKFTVLTTTGRFNTPVAGALNLQLQTTTNTVFAGSPSITWTDAYAHAWARLPSSAWGAFGGAEFFFGTIASAGVEAKHYIGNISAGGDVAYLWTSASHAWQASATANLFLTPNTRIGVGAQYINGFSGTNIWDVRVDAEMRFAHVPWSVFAWATAFDSSGVAASAGLLGFRWYLDGPNSTLQSHDRDVPFFYQSLIPLL
jgi:hypothetical protein